MESRQEIEQMRVVELREFLRRHDVPIKNVARKDGTPGPPRKSELLSAALDVWQIHTTTQQTPAQPTNPFQRRRSSPAPLHPSRRSSEQPGSGSDSDMAERSRPSSSRVSEGETRRQPVAEVSTSTPSRARRRSSSWVDPSLLAQLQTPSLSNVKGKPTTERNVAQRGGQQHARTRSSSGSVSARRPGSVVEGEQSALETHDMDDVVKGAAPSARPASRRSASTRLERPSSAQRRTRQSDVAPVATRRSPRTRRLLDIDENYLSDEDPDYEADGEPAEEEDDSEGSEDEHHKSVEVIDLTYGASNKEQQALQDVDDEIRPVHVKDMRRETKESGQEDIPFDSDAYESDRAQHSDRGSTVDTEDEEQLVDFTQWSAKNIRDWLRAHNVRFANLASKEELVGLVRAKVLQMETMGEDELSPVKQKSVEEPREKETSNLRRRRGITLPTEVDDDGEVVFVQQQSRRKPNGKKSKSTESRNVTKNIRRVDGRRVVAMTSCLILWCVLIALWLYALKSIYLVSRIPFCDKDSTSNYTVNGELCRRCPLNGVCSDGSLFCDSGFIQSGAQCVRDHVFDRLVDDLADYAARNLSELAGRAECGETNTIAITYEELADNLVAHFYERRRNDPSFFRVGIEDLQLVQSATHQAIGSLNEARYGVIVNDNGTFSSNRPRISFQCRLKRKVMENLYEVLVGAVVCLLLLLIRVKIYLIRLRQRQCEAAHQRALEVLRDQVIGFRHNEEDVAFVSDVMLREEVLGRPTKQVIKLWKDVEESLKSDPRVLRKHQTIRGMPSYTFEYVGSRRSSGSVFDGFSRRSSSFGSRASLDSLDLRPDDDFDVTPRRGLGSYVMRWLDGR